MRSDHKEIAESLFMKTDMSKAEIAQLLGISRRTVHYWASDNEWDRLKKSTDNMPAIGTENAWLILTTYQEKLLSPDRAFNQFTNDEVSNLYKLGTLVRKLTRGNALNETIEMRNRFMEFVSKKNPEKALEVQSLLDDYIKSLAKVRPRTLMPGKLDELGCIPNKEENIKEIQLDIENQMFWSDNPPTKEPGLYEGMSHTNPPEAEERTAATPSPLGEGRGEALSQTDVLTVDVRSAATPCPPERAGLRSLHDVQINKTAPQLTHLDRLAILKVETEQFFKNQSPHKEITGNDSEGMASAPKGEKCKQAQICIPQNKNLNRAQRRLLLKQAGKKTKT